MQLDLANITLSYVTKHFYQDSFKLYDYDLENDSYIVEMRKYLREEARPVIDYLLESGFENEDDIESFMLLKTTQLHFRKMTQEEKNIELKEKAEEKKKASEQAVT